MAFDFKARKEALKKHALPRLSSGVYCDSEGMLWLEVGDETHCFNKEEALKLANFIREVYGD